jgi:hypothetical protein
MLLHGLHGFFRGQLSLGQDGSDGFGCQLAATPGDHRVKVGFFSVAEINVPFGLRGSESKLDHREAGN